MIYLWTVWSIFMWRNEPVAVAISWDDL